MLEILKKPYFEMSFIDSIILLGVILFFIIILPAIIYAIKCKIQEVKKKIEDRRKKRRNERGKYYGMDEEEIIETFKHWIEYEKANKDRINKAEELIEIQEGLLNLYKQEKEKNKELEAKLIWNKLRIEELKKELVQEKEKNKLLQSQLNGAFDRGFISKEKIKERIKELEKKYTEQPYFEYDIYEVTDICINELKGLLEEV